MWLQSHLAAKLSKCNSCRAASCHASKIEIFVLSFCLSYKHAPSFFMAQLIINFNSHVSELAGLLGPSWSNQLWTHLLVNNYSRHWGGGVIFRNEDVSAHLRICKVRSGRCVRLCELLLSARSAKKASHMHTHTQWPHLRAILGNALQGELKGPWFPPLSLSLLNSVF